MTHLTLVPVVDPNDPKRLNAKLTMDGSDDLSCTFGINHYSALRLEERQWYRLEPINKFFRTVSEEDGLFILMTFTKIKDEIRKAGHGRDLNIHMIGEVLLQMFDRLDLTERLGKFIREDVAINIPSSVDDIEYKTERGSFNFSRSDYQQILTVMLVSKLLFPIYGELLDYYRSSSYSIDQCRRQVSHVVDTLTAAHFSHIVMKVASFIMHITVHCLGDYVPRLFGPRAITVFTEERMASFLVLGGINYDLYKEGGDVVRWLYVVIRRDLVSKTGWRSLPL